MPTSLVGFGAFTPAAGGGGSGYEAEADALFARFGTDPGTTRKDAINACILSLKTAGIWSKLDCLYVFAAHTEADALLNWISTNDNLTENGTMNFTTDRGFLANSADNANHLIGSRAINTLTNYLQNSAHISSWTTSTGNASYTSVGASSSATEASIFPRFTDNNAYLRVNDDPGSGGISVANGSGFYLGNRSSSTARQAYKDGSAIGSYGTVNSKARGGDFFRYGAGNTAHRIHMASVGGSLTSGEVTDFYNAMNTLKTAIGW